MSMLGSVVFDVNVVLMPILLSVLLNFSNMPGAYGITAVSSGFFWCVIGF